jgi:autotransporter-associated beta strand protein
MTLNSGTIFAQKPNALGSGFVTVNNGTLDVGTHHQTVGPVTLAGGVINGSTGIITGSTYQVQSGLINARLGGTASLTKSTAGTVTLTSSNIYSGGSTLNGGKLVVNNTSGSGTGSGNVTINNSGVLAGTGTITGSVTNNPGGTISAGDVNLIGKLTTGSQVWSGGATNIWEIKDVDSGEGIGWDMLSISGGLNLTATTVDKFFLDLRSLTLGGSSGLVGDFDSSQGYIWTIARTVTGITFGAGENETTVFQLLLGGFMNATDGGTFTIALGNSGKDLNVVFTPAAVPEPNPVGMISLGFALLLYHQRRNRL